MSDYYIKLELIDLANTSGSPTLVFTTIEGNSLSVFPSQTQFSVKNQSSSEKYTVPILSRIVGSGLEILSGTSTLTQVINPSMVFAYNGASGQYFTGANDDWETGPYAAAISGLGYRPSGGQDSAAVMNVLEGIATIDNYSGGNYQPYLIPKRSRVDLIRLYDNAFKIPQQIYSGNDIAWISYNFSGTNNKKVFAYTLEMLRLISGLSGSGTNVQNYDSPYAPTELLYYSGRLTSGSCAITDLLLETTGSYCQLPESFVGNDDGGALIACFTTGTPLEIVQSTMRDITSGLRKTLSSAGSIKGDFVDDSAVTVNYVDGSYAQYEGLFEFNHPYTGDSFLFASYNYEYTGTYYGTYFEYPPYNEYAIEFRYPQDYTDIDSFVDILNTRLSGNNYYIWNRSTEASCFSPFSGYYESGNLLTAEKSGNNHVIVRSTRIGTMGGYRWTRTVADRPISGVVNQNILKYMLPKSVFIQGSQDHAAWVTVNSQNNVLWDNVEPSVYRDNNYSYLTGLTTGESGLVSNTNAESGFDIDLFLTGAYYGRKVAEVTVSGNTRCRTSFARTVEFWEIPSGVDCVPTGGEGGIDTTTMGGGGVAATGEELNSPVDYHILKTGWKFYNEQEYNYYRIVFSGLDVEQRNQNIGITQSFLLNNLVFYGYNTGNQLLSGSICLFGAEYSGQIMGFTTGIITGSVTSGADAYGRLCYTSLPVTGYPENNGAVKFQNATGKAVGGFTGLLTDCITGTGFYIDEVQGYFYNSGNSCIETSRLVSGFINGSGFISGGPYPIIRDEIIPQLSSYLVTVVGTGEGMMSGIIPDFTYPFQNIEAFGYVEGVLSGIVLPGSGYFYFNQFITGLPVTGYYNILSGTQEATNVLSYNVPESGDTLYINDLIIIYSPNTGDTAPTYFKTINELNDIINSGMNNFLCSGYNDGSNIYLTSLLGGTSGNLINSISSGSLTRPSFVADTFQSGVDYYRLLTATGIFTGQIQQIVYASGTYTGMSSGYLTGTIKQLDFIRYFTGIWNIYSGEENYRNNQWVSGGGSRYQNSGFSPLTLYTGHPEAIPLTIVYNNSPLVLSNDYAKLTVTGLDAGSGIVMILSGQF